jgi:hypothetical protein
MSVACPSTQTLVARHVRAPHIPAWFSEITPTDAPRWHCHWLGAMFRNSYQVLAPIVFTDAY